MFAHNCFTYPPEYSRNSANNAFILLRDDKKYIHIIYKQ